MSMLSIPMSEYARKVHASWIGQCVGNMFGLGYENLFIDEPMPHGQDPVWAPWVLDLIRQADGAFSDDDTDVEYMYLLAMEAAKDEQGGSRDVTCEELARRWMHHVRSHVWVANRAALGLMHHGLRPPATGRQGVSPHWFQIDAQLVNEIWGVTAPGMLRHAADRSAWAARVMADGWGIEPTIHYGVMYAAAFFENDVAGLVDLAGAFLPQDGRFARTVRHLRELHAAHPDDWCAARRQVCQTYFHEEDPATKTIWNANLNAAAGILALLYGGGDFRRTLEMCCRIGFDTDNQAATMCGLVAMLVGVEGIPDELLFPLPERRWDQPLNDRYHNRTRHDLPDASLADQSRRIAEQGVATVLRAGGRLEDRSGEPWLVINADANFVAPSEKDAVCYALRCGERENLTRSASGILAHCRRLDEAALERIIVFAPRALLADGVDVIHRQAPEPCWPPPACAAPRSFYGFGPQDTEHFYGYEWPHPVRIEAVVFRVGTLEEVGGWFADPRIEVLAEAPEVGDRSMRGAPKVREEWRVVADATWSPSCPPGDQPLRHAPWVQYEIRFPAVEARAVRIIGRAGGTGNFTSIASLAVFGSPAASGSREGDLPA
ncbi:MAG: ADP-ribosylglycohydrolase family protein [Phycisphaerales bacterium]|nr:ADP-ribosylglycohydrolase family protein [Phycisphaerales bacterium]